MTATAQYTIPLIYITCFLFLFGETIQPAPRIAIYESIVYRQYYGSSGPHDCKVPQVQEELALLGGIERLSIIIPSILAIPFAALADRYGHSLILAIAISGVLMEDAWAFLVTWFPDVFPIRLIWIHFVFSLVGGGFTVVITLLHVIIADVVGAEERTIMFFRMRAAGVAASILGYAASGLMMRVNDYFPWAVGLVSLVLGTVTAAMIPNRTVETDGKPPDDGLMAGGLMQKARSLIESLKSIASLLIGNKQVLGMLILVFLCQMGFDAGPTMLTIYISKRYGWAFADVSALKTSTDRRRRLSADDVQASFLSSLEMSVELFMLVLVLPFITIIVPRLQKLSPSIKDKYIAEWSLAALAVGQFCLGCAPVAAVAILGTYTLKHTIRLNQHGFRISLTTLGIAILALGAGQDSLLRSLATELVASDEISTMYSAITMLRAIGGSISGPFYAWLYTLGLRQRSKIWLGLPYLIAGALFVIALALLISLTVKERDGYEAIEEQEDTAAPA